MAIKKEKNRESKKKTDGDDSLGEDGATEGESDVDIGNAEEDVKKLKDVLGREGDIEKIVVKGSKPISALKKGDKIKVDGKEYEIDAHYVLIDHGKTKEMTIEVFDPKTDKDFQLRYFSDQVETSIEFYALEEIMYVRRQMKKVEW